MMNIISYLKVEDEETDLMNDINLPLQTLDGLDKLENTLNHSVKMNILVKLNLILYMLWNFTLKYKYKYMYVLKAIQF